MDINSDPDEVPPLSARPLEDSEWGRYPQSLFGNWKPEQVERSKMLTNCSDRKQSIVYKFDVFDDGKFDKRIEILYIRKDEPVELRAYWDHMGMPVSAMLIAYSEIEAASATSECPTPSTFC